MTVGLYANFINGGEGSDKSVGLSILYLGQPAFMYTYRPIVEKIRLTAFGIHI